MNQNGYNTQANVVVNQYQNIGKNSNPQSLFFTSNSFAEDKNTWYLDIACSNHMYGKKKLFSSLDEYVKLLVKFGNNSNIPILVKGQISIRLKDDSQNFIFDVFYVSGLHHNLLSMRQLSEKGYTCRFMKDIVQWLTKMEDSQPR